MSECGKGLPGSGERGQGQCVRIQKEFCSGWWVQAGLQGRRRGGEADFRGLPTCGGPCVLSRFHFDQVLGKLWGTEGWWGWRMGPGSKAASREEA